jgi:hypothetical protein
MKYFKTLVLGTCLLVLATTCAILTGGEVFTMGFLSGVIFGVGCLTLMLFVAT